jgi:ATP adenylyltransferase
MSLEHLWAGWRYQYVASATEAERHATGTEGLGSGDGPDGLCVFCRIIASGPPSVDNGIVWRGLHAVVLLNAYPYASGHVLVMPLRHVRTLGELDQAESAQIWGATMMSLQAVEDAYKPDGINLGANVGRAAGAGIPQHVHLHVVPRWSGDTNFMTTVAGVRVLPESLPDSWRKMTAAWGARLGMEDLGEMRSP